MTQILMQLAALLNNYRWVYDRDASTYSGTPTSKGDKTAIDVLIPATGPTTINIYTQGKVKGPTVSIAIDGTQVNVTPLTALLAAKSMAGLSLGKKK